MLIAGPSSAAHACAVRSCHDTSTAGAAPGRTELYTESAGTNIAWSNMHVVHALVFCAGLAAPGVTLLEASSDAAAELLANNVNGLRSWEGSLLSRQLKIRIRSSEGDGGGAAGGGVWHACAGDCESCDERSRAGVLGAAKEDITLKP
jgi:hypothetical protein